MFSNFSFKIFVARVESENYVMECGKRSLKFETRLEILRDARKTQNSKAMTIFFKNFIKIQVHDLLALKNFRDYSTTISEIQGNKISEQTSLPFPPPS